MMAATHSYAESVLPAREFSVGAAAQRLATRCGVSGLALVAVGLATSKAAQNIGMALMLAGILLSGPRAWNRLSRDPLLWLCIVWIAFVLGSAWLAAARVPAYANMQWDETLEMARLLYLPLCAWWFAAGRQPIRLYLCLAVAGVLLAIVLRLDWARLPLVLLGQLDAPRSGFGANAQHFGYLCAMTLAACGTFYSEWLDGGRRWLRSAAWLAVVALVLTAFIWTQARTAWIAFILLVGIALLVSILRRRRVEPFARDKLGLLAALLVAGLFTYVQWSTIHKRVAPELEVVQTYLAEGTEPAKLSSTLVRLHLWGIAWDGIKERPLGGWGPGAEEMLIAEASGVPDYIKRFDHVHNSFLGLAVRGGLIAVGVFIAVAALVGRVVWSAWRKGRLDGRIAAYLGIAFGVFLVVNVTESYLARQLGWFVAAFFGGAGYSFALRGSTARYQETSS